ncbi:MAG: PTS sugar transporter subunit IIA [Waddliaceae bacterium]|nr:PTS sugar transporter subunit IIA [Waddliaceae bacterium]
MKNIYPYLDPKLVTFSYQSDRDSVLKELVMNLADHHQFIEPDPFYHAILDREAVVSTGIGMGVAIPHAKMAHYDDFFIAIGINKNGVNWNSLDRQPVRLIFMIGGPDDKQTEYLQILSALTMAIKDDQRRKQMLRLTSPEEIVSLFSDF